MLLKRERKIKFYSDVPWKEVTCVSPDYASWKRLLQPCLPPPLGERLCQAAFFFNLSRFLTNAVRAVQTWHTFHKRGWNQVKPTCTPVGPELLRSGPNTENLRPNSYVCFCEHGTVTLALADNGNVAKCLMKLDIPRNCMSSFLSKFAFSYIVRQKKWTKK